MSRQVSPSMHRPYSLLRVTEVWGASRATVYRHRRDDEARPRRRPGPIGPLPDPALVTAIRELLAVSPFHGEGYRKLWARLRFAGIRTSKRRVLRLTREHGLQAPGRVGRAHGPKTHNGTIRTQRVDEMWGTDLTSTMTGEGQASIFVTVDHGSTECLGIHAARRATRFEALEPLRQSVRSCFGAFAAGIAAGLKVRHDHGSQFIADDYRRELAFLGIESSPAFVREPEGNGGACPRAAKGRPGGRALHPHAQGELAVGPPLRHHRRAAPSPEGLQGHLQPELDRRAPRLSNASPSPRRPARPGRGSMIQVRCLKSVDRYTHGLVEE